MTPHPDTDRLRYEIEAKTEFKSLWTNGTVKIVSWGLITNYYNSIGKRIATFRLKAWK